MKNNAIITYRGVSKEVYMDERIIHISDLTEQISVLHKEHNVPSSADEDAFTRGYSYIALEIAEITGAIFSDDPDEICVDFLEVSDEMRKRGILINCDAVYSGEEAEIVSLN
jgi:hypothetical protein